MKISNPFLLWIFSLSSTLTVMAGVIIALVLNLMRTDLGVADPVSAEIIITIQGIFIALCGPSIGSTIPKTGYRRFENAQPVV
jgi:ACDE family multidrug resistance protein